MVMAHMLKSHKWIDSGTWIKIEVTLASCNPLASFKSRQNWQALLVHPQYDNLGTSDTLLEVINLIDQSHYAKKWCIMVEFQTFYSCYSYEVGCMWLRFCKTLVTRCSLPYQQFLFAFGSFILVFGIYAIIHPSSLLLGYKDM